MINKSGHGKSVDWWSLGILMFDMLTGDPPFNSKNRKTLLEKILKDNIRYPRYLTKDVCHLISGLLNRSPTARLACGPTGSKALKSHRFFKGMSWTKLYNKEITPPYKPEIKKKPEVRSQKFRQRNNKSPGSRLSDREFDFSQPREAFLGFQLRQRRDSSGF